MIDGDMPEEEREKIVEKVSAETNRLVALAGPLGDTGLIRAIVAAGVIMTTGATVEWLKENEGESFNRQAMGEAMLAVVMGLYEAQTDMEGGK